MSRGPRLSIPTRIFLGFVLVLLGFGAVAGVSLLQHERSAATLRLLHEGYLPLALAVGEAKATQAVVGTLLDRLLAESDPSASRSWLHAARRVRPATIRRALFAIDQAEHLQPSAEDLRELRQMRSDLERVTATYESSDAPFDALFEALASGDRDRAAEILGELEGEEQAAERTLRRCWSLVQQRIASTSARAADDEREAALTLGVMALIALVVGLGVTWWSQRMLAPLPRLQQRVAAVARGDLARGLGPHADDELGRLAAEFERMVEALAARDARLREAAEAQRRLQEMQERIVTDLRAAIVVADGHGAVRIVNPAAARVLGIGADAVGKPLAATELFERVAPLRTAIAEVQEGADRAVITGQELPDRRAVNALVTPFHAEARGEAGRAVLVVAEDVTEELRTKSRLIQTERLAAIGRMAAHVTHEVRNPLSSIGLNVEMLEEEISGSGTEARALLRAIQREIDRLTAVTEEYLRLARLPQPRLEPEDLGEIAESTAGFVRPEMTAAKVTLEVKIDPELPTVAVDEPQIRQSLLNLLRNAREAMPGGGTVTLTVRAVDGGVAVRVQDRGAGIRPEERDRIFDLFYTTKEGGTGLGLPLTQQIVVAHGGKIRCESTPGAGTTFELWLPVAPAPARSPSAPQETPART